jgi:hypothetical protein
MMHVIELDETTVCDGCECELCLETAYVSKRGLMCAECDDAYKAHDALEAGELSYEEHYLYTVGA